MIVENKQNVTISVPMIKIVVRKNLKLTKVPELLR